MRDLNSASRDFNHEPVSWEDLNSLSDCAVIADDLMDLSKKNFSHLQKLVNYTARHHRVSPVVLIVHSVTKNNLFSLVKHMDEFWFTLDKQNAPSLATVCDILLFEKVVKSSFVSRFLAEPGEFGIFVLSAQKRTLERLPGSGGGGDVTSVGDVGRVPCGDPLAPYRRTAEAFLPHFCADPARTLVIFNYIIEKLPLSAVDPATLTIKLARRESGVALKLSLLDYLVMLTSEARPTGNLVALHRYVTKHADLPLCFVRNRHLRPRPQ